MKLNPVDSFGRDAVCPCFELFDGTMFRPAGDVVNVDGMRIQRFATQARNVTDAYAVSDPKRGTAWVPMVNGPTSVLGVHAGRAWIRVPVFMDPGSSLVSVDAANGTVRSWVFESEGVIDARAVTEKGIEVVDEVTAKPGSYTWQQVEDAVKGK